MNIDRSEITGLVLAGGRGSRMGGVDKGLQVWAGKPLALHAAERLEPQVGALLFNANRNLDRYAAFGWPVVPDARAEPSTDGPADYSGPLAGMLAGLHACRTAYLVTVPCDSPLFPVDLVHRLAQALQSSDAQIAVAATLENGQPQPQPVFCLITATLRDSLAAYLQSGQRKIDRWAVQQRCAQVVFDQADAFFNANTVIDLLHLQGGPHRS